MIRDKRCPLNHRQPLACDSLSKWPMFSFARHSTKVLLNSMCHKFFSKNRYITHIFLIDLPETFPLSSPSPPHLSLVFLTSMFQTFPLQASFSESMAEVSWIASLLAKLLEIALSQAWSKRLVIKRLELLKGHFLQVMCMFALSSVKVGHLWIYFAFPADPFPVRFLRLQFHLASWHSTCIHTQLQLPWQSSNYIDTRSQDYKDVVLHFTSQSFNKDPLCNPADLDPEQHREVQD